MLRFFPPHSFVRWFVCYTLQFFINGFMSVTNVYIILLFSYALRFMSAKRKKERKIDPSSRNIFFSIFSTQDIKKNHTRFVFFFLSEKRHIHTHTFFPSVFWCECLTKPTTMSERLACFANTFTDLITVWRVLYQFKRITYFSSSYSALLVVPITTRTVVCSRFFLFSFLMIPRHGYENITFCVCLKRSKSTVNFFVLACVCARESLEEVERLKWATGLIVFI